MARRPGFFDDLMSIGLKLPWKIEVAAAVVIFAAPHVVVIYTQTPVSTNTLADLGAVVQHGFIHVFAQFFQCIIPADGGVDLGLTKDGQRYLVQCKHWRKRQVGVTVVRESCVSPCSKRVPNQVGCGNSSGDFPADLRKALAAAAEARAVWSDLTPIARRDWIHWITSAKQSETRARRIRNACEMLAAGKRRVCCFDRSGFYSKNFGAPKAAD
jgi:Bacteriocin-protection, YdeI or OmpD-Associated/Restriction endonuclease